MTDTETPRGLGPRGVAILLGVAQTLAWGTTYYLPAILIPAVLEELGGDRTLIYGAFSLALLISGFAAPRVGRAIEQWGGRPVLMLSSCVLSTGLVLLALLPGLGGWFIAWVVLGIGMALGLYEAAFATLGVLFGRAARRPITMVTLLAGFASTVGWPMTAALVPEIGWRNTCLFYVGINMLVVLPLYWLLPRGHGGEAAAQHAQEAAPPPTAWMRRAFLLLACFFTIRALITGVVAVHFVVLFGGLGLSVAAAVAVGALQGPSQVSGRLLEFTLGSNTHPLTVAKAGAALLPLGAALLLWAPLEVGLAASLFMVMYGGSNGLLTISKGQVPLALFGPKGYPVLMGKLAMPILVAQAIAPTLSAPVVASLPSGLVFGLVLALSALALACLLPLRSAPPPA